jgi:hypothetical protein
MPTITDRLFTDHPRSLGMSWASHAAGAVKIGARLIGAGTACMVHAIFPGLFTETAGRTITSMYEHMVQRRTGSANPNQWPEYEI